MQRNIKTGTETQIKKYLQEFEGGFESHVAEFHAKSLNKLIRAYLSKYLNALNYTEVFFLFLWDGLGELLESVNFLISMSIMNLNF